MRDLEEHNLPRIDYEFVAIELRAQTSIVSNATNATLGVDLNFGSGTGARSPSWAVRCVVAQVP